MKELEFHYQMKLSFSSPVCQNRFTVKCFPPTTERQQILTVKSAIEPASFLSESRDSFGNRSVYGCCPDETRTFSIDLSGSAAVGCSNVESYDESRSVMLYKYQSAQTKPGPAILDTYHRLNGSGKRTNLERAEAITHYLFASLAYVPQSTCLATSAEEAMSQRKGVCQDYSHIMLSLLRLDRIPCRYVAGMLMGEGSSHAWVEVWQDGAWYPFDPTNDIPVLDQHIKLSNGRDSRDCLINQGVFVGMSTQTQAVSVLVKEKEEHVQGEEE